MPGASPDVMESEAMEKISVWGFRWAPDFAQGLVRDLRVRWALIEAGRDYEIELIGFEERASGTYRQRQPFGMVPAFEAGSEEHTSELQYLLRISYSVCCLKKKNIT